MCPNSVQRCGADWSTILLAYAKPNSSQIDPHFALLGTELYMQQNFTNTIWLQKYGI